MIEEFAAAKINLTLSVTGRRADGYHELESLVAFALDVGDRLTFEQGPGSVLTTSGPEADAIDGANLITSVVEAMVREHSSLTVGAFHLEKNLPVASGIGGGSADAAAAMRAIARANGIADPGTAFAAIAARLGADIPVCIGAVDRGPDEQAALMSGIGERIWRPPAGISLLPPGGLAAILVNPRVPVSTGAVFKALAAPVIASGTVASTLSPFATFDDCLAYITANPNDLEGPAIAIAPVILSVLTAIFELDGCRLARMSGSGATCFGLFDSIEAAKSAAKTLSDMQSDWWVAATRLG